MNRFFDLPSQAVQNFDYVQNSVIKPAEGVGMSRNTPIKKYTRFVLDSRDRNTTAFPTPSTYEIILDESINDITSIKVQKCDVPLSNYDVNEYNNKLHVTFNGGTIIPIIIPVGNYNTSINRTYHDVNTAAASDMVSFASTVQTYVSAYESSFTCSYIANTDSFSFTASIAFTFEFTGTPIRYGVQMNNNSPSMITPYVSCSIGKVLGFLPTQYMSVHFGSIYSIIPPFRRNFTDKRYCVLNMENLSMNTSINSNIYKSFALLDGQSDTDVIKSFNPSIRLNKIKVQFTDYEGNPYNFRNHEHRIEFVFESTFDPRISSFTNI